MAANAKTFGGAISEARKAKGWALKDLASRVLREDKEAISPQYLNDIEHDRRSPSSDRVVQQFADALGSTATGSIISPGVFPKTYATRSFPKGRWRRRWSPSGAASGVAERARAVADGEIRS